MDTATNPTVIDPITGTFELIPLDNIRVSPLHLQGLRRARFDHEALLQLAANIQAIGVQQPIVVRPVPVKGHVRFEIVCGERRYLAADRAGLAHIPAIVRDLTDEATLEVQLSENIERESLHPLEEGQGFRELMDMKRIDAAAVGALFGKSRAYVYTRTKLLDLCAPAREALQKGEIDASKALLLARIHGEKLQAKALKIVLEEGRWYSYKRLFEKLRDGFMIKLHTSPFNADDTTLTTKQHQPLPACVDCPHRSGNDPELLEALENDADVCTERACFDLKSAAYFRRLRADAEAAGAKILSGEDAKGAVPSQYHTVSNAGYVNLNDECGDIEFSEPEPKQEKGESDEEFGERCDAYDERSCSFTPPTYRQVIGEVVADDTVLAEGKQGALIELVPVDAVVKALKAKGIKPGKHRYRLPDSNSVGSASPSPERQAQLAAERAKEEEQEKIETEYRSRLFKEIWAKWKGPFKRPDLERIADQVCEGDWYAENPAADLMPKPGKIASLTEAELLRVIACGLFAHECDDLYDKPGQMLEAAQRFKIDAKKIRAQVISELKPTAAPKPDKPAAKKKAAKK
jgi:ParB/RepB/Spo0J family partition protein